MHLLVLNQWCESNWRITLNSNLLITIVWFIMGVLIGLRWMQYIHISQLSSICFHLSYIVITLVVGVLVWYWGRKADVWTMWHLAVDGSKNSASVYALNFLFSALVLFLWHWKGISWMQKYAIVMHKVLRAWPFLELIQKTEQVLGGTE